MTETEKKKLTIEDLISSQEETQRILKAVLWEIEESKGKHRKKNDNSLQVAVLFIGISSMVIGALCLAGAAIYTWPHDAGNPIGATANASQATNLLIASFGFLFFGLFLCNSKK